MKQSAEEVIPHLGDGDLLAKNAKRLPCMLGARSRRTLAVARLNTIVSANIMLLDERLARWHGLSEDGFATIPLQRGSCALRIISRTREERIWCVPASQ